MAREDLLRNAWKMRAKRGINEYNVLQSILC